MVEKAQQRPLGREATACGARSSMFQNRTRLGGERVTLVLPVWHNVTSVWNNKPSLVQMSDAAFLFFFLNLLNPDSHDADQLILASFSQLHKVGKQFRAFGFAKP